MKRNIYKAVLGSLAILSSGSVSAYSDCWTSYFDPSAYPIAYDDSGVRYIGGLPAGVTCGCTVNTSTIWISGEKKGVTAATLAASLAGKQIKFLLHEEYSDGYCRSSIVEVKAN